jgi:hypothetical protein
VSSEIDPIDTSHGAEILRNAIALGSPDPTFATAVRQDVADENDEAPFIIFRRVAVDRDVSLDGTLMGVTETYHIECWGDNREQEMVMENTVVDLLLAAGWPPRSNDTDGFDPTMKLRAGVIVVNIDL